MPGISGASTSPASIGVRSKKRVAKKEGYCIYLYSERERFLSQALGLLSQAVGLLSQALGFLSQAVGIFLGNTNSAVSDLDMLITSSLNTKLELTKNVAFWLCDTD